MRTTSPSSSPPSGTEASAGFGTCRASARSSGSSAVSAASAAPSSSLSRAAASIFAGRSSADARPISLLAAFCPLVAPARRCRVFGSARVERNHLVEQAQRDSLALDPDAICGVVGQAPEIDHGVPIVGAVLSPLARFAHGAGGPSLRSRAAVSTLHAVPDAANELIEQHAATRMFEGDHTLWSPDPAEITNRLGWLDKPDHMLAALDAVQRQPTTHGPAVSVTSCGAAWAVRVSSPSCSRDRRSWPPTRHRAPCSTRAIRAAIARAAEAAEATSTLYASRRSRAARSRPVRNSTSSRARCGDAAHFAVVTDPARARPARDGAASRPCTTPRRPLAGATRRYRTSGSSLHRCSGSTSPRCSSGPLRWPANAAPTRRPTPASLGALLGGSARDGRDKAVLDRACGVAQWLEQLIAESTGKHDKGILPVPGDVADANGPDRLRVSYGRGGDLDLGAADVTSDAAALGREVMRWEIATALAGAVLQINPFDQPDVEAAKKAASKVLAEGTGDIATVALTDALCKRGAGSLRGAAGLRRSRRTGCPQPRRPPCRGARSHRRSRDRGHRASLPALHRTVAQGRPAVRHVRTDARRRSPASRDPRVATTAFTTSSPRKPPAITPRLGARAAEPSPASPPIGDPQILDTLSAAHARDFGVIDHSGTT